MVCANCVFLSMIKNRIFLKFIKIKKFKFFSNFFKDRANFPENPYELYRKKWERIDVNKIWIFRFYSRSENKQPSREAVT